MTLLISFAGGAEFIFLFFFGMIAVYLIFLAKLQSTFDAISHENRRMRPGQVWLMLIPVFSLFWAFKVVSDLSDSIAAEANSKCIELKYSRPSYNIGLAMCISACLCWVPLINIIAIIMFYVSWIIYWSEITTYRKLLTNVRVFDHES